MKRKQKTICPPTESSLLNLISEHGQPLRTEGILALTGCRGINRRQTEKMLRALVEQGRIARLPGGFWGPSEKAAVVTGEYIGFTNGGGRLRVTEPAEIAQKELFISPFHTGGAWPKDIVRALVLPRSAAKVLEIVKRSQTEIPAIFEGRHKNRLRFRPADGKLKARFYASPGQKPGDLAPGDLAVLRPLENLGEDKWQAEILRPLGSPDQVSAQESIVKISQNVPGPFPELALEQARSLPAGPTEADIRGREDLRGLDFVTIDGKDARDFDDAIHVEKTADGFLLRVAIADVSHYVRPDARPGSLDAEALCRGNSWYFPRSVEPMLPRELSNGLCSLRPDEDRLAMLVEMPFDREGRPLESRFAQIVMRSAGRLIYDDVARFFAGEKEAIASRLAPMLENSYELYKILAANRRRRGTLDFFLPEPAYEFDERGRLVAMGEAERNDAHMLIEEFMIAANEAVAGWLGRQKQEFLYRVHPRPEPEKLARLYETLKLTAVEMLPPDLRLDDEPNPDAIQQILARAYGTPQEYVVNRLCLRSMAQARYQPQNIGHFGLASPAYCHFTSPIRRYADLLTHRALKAATKTTDQQSLTAEDLAKIGDQLNALERRAVDCEREMARRLGCLYLDGKEGETFAGTISGVTDFGVFVEFSKMPAEGLIRMEELGSDWFRLDQARQMLIGEHSGEIWRLGQPVQVKVLSVNLDNLEIRLAPAARRRDRNSRDKPARQGGRGQRRGQKRLKAR